MKYHIKSRSKRTRAFIDAVLPSIIDQLGLTNSRKELFINMTRMEALEGNDGMASYLRRFDCIVVLLRPTYNMEKLGITLAHEMVHVKQLAKGKLKNVKVFSYRNGKKYINRTKYLDQPWEIEAFSKQELMLRRAIQ